MNFCCSRLYIIWHAGFLVLFIDAVTLPFKVNCKNPQTTQINRNFTLNCTTEGRNSDELTFVQWYKGGSVLAVYTENSNHNGNDQSTRFALDKNRIRQGDISLDITDVQKIDEGNYHYAVSTIKVLREGDILLKVKLPYEVECPSPQIAFPNMNTLINCTIKNLNSDMLTYVFWTKDHNILASYRRTKSEVTPVQQSRFSLSQDIINQGDFSLYIRDIQQSDNGLYRYSLGIDNTHEEGEVMLEIRAQEIPSVRKWRVATVCAVGGILACVVIAAVFLIRRRGTTVTEVSTRRPESLQLEVREPQNEESAQLDE
ncbi:uncharacterized protein LOC114661865 [Erpetoichthys calabaricus]|uniref:uncharacterized protein LOC114661865 n=1 Tax=Erpetoichthys calabaricus TaxID=27687 RepID=UPI00109FEB04|nr:uncharacterized protein LOC114661865 [Erpetoichthys calabaricus]